MGLAVLLLISVCASLDPAELNEATEYLKQYGYLSSSSSPAHKWLETEQMNKALRIFQKVTELPVTGHLDKKTLVMMRAARCGVKDPFNKILKYQILGHWRKKRLSYRIYNFPLHLGLAKTQAAIQAAFRYWSDVSPLRFHEVSRRHADIKISFHRKDRDCPVPFDGPGRVLGHAEAPESGTVHFDADEVWTEGRSYGSNLRIVATHEIGHALGLGHSQYHSALMGPVYTGYRDNFKLHPDDIRGIQMLYGKPEERPSSGPRHPDTQAAVLDPCSAEINAIMLGPFQKIFVFSGGYVWTFSDSGYNSPVQINVLWKELPSNINAAVHSQRTNKSYFLKGDKVWRYSGFKMDRGYPKRFTIPPNIHAAFYLNSIKMLIFIRGSEFWVWDELGSGKERLLYPKPLAKLITGLPLNPDAAFTWTNGHVYVFKGEKYWRINPRMSIDKGYPLSTREQWMHCED